MDVKTKSITDCLTACLTHCVFLSLFQYVPPALRGHFHYRQAQDGPSAGQRQCARVRLPGAGHVATLALHGGLPGHRSIAPDVTPVCPESVVSLCLVCCWAGTMTFAHSLFIARLFFFFFCLFWTSTSIETKRVNC